MRFTGVKYGAMSAIFDQLAEQCDIIEPNKHKPLLHDKNTNLKAFSALAERHATRRAIRIPAIFGNSLIKSTYSAIKMRKFHGQYQSIFKSASRDTSRTALIFNGYLAPNALLASAAEKLSMPTLYFENGFFPNTVQCDIQGINGYSTVPRSASFYRAISKQVDDLLLPSDLLTRKTKLSASGNDLDIKDLPKDFVFVPFQVPSDMQILALSPWIRDMMHLYDELYEIAEQVPELQFVIKEHPSFRISIQNKVRAHSRIHFSNHTETSTLLKRANAVVTINSNVGLESISAGKKTIILGEAHYDVEGLCLRAHDRQSLVAHLCSLDKWEVDELIRNTYLRFIHSVYLLPFDREQPVEDTARLLEMRVNGSDLYGQLLQEHKATISNNIPV